MGVCVCQVVNEMYGDSVSGELDDLPLHSGQYHMAEFAKKYFREAQRNRRSDAHTYCRNNVSKCPYFKSLQLQLVADCCRYFVHSEQKAKKGKEGRDPVDMVKFSKVKSGVKVKNVHVFVFLYMLSSLSTILCIVLLHKCTLTLLFVCRSSLRSMSL